MKTIYFIFDVSYSLKQNIDLKKYNIYIHLYDILYILGREFMFSLI